MGLKIERIKLPRSDGDVREYPRFKADFSKLVAPEMKSDGSEEYVLKSCLGNLPIDVVKNVDDDVVLMWQRLDEKYGRPSKLVVVVMLDIKRIEPIKVGDDSSFIDLFDKVGRGYRDLSRIKMDAEIGNTTTISLIEERLPKDVNREWSKFVNSREDFKTKFPDFLKFLLAQKRILEYKNDNIRITMREFSFWGRYAN